MASREWQLSGRYFETPCGRHGPNCDSSQGYWHDRKIPQFAGGFDGGGANPIELRRSPALGRDFTRDDQTHSPTRSPATDALPSSASAYLQRHAPSTTRESGPRFEPTLLAAVTSFPPSPARDRCATESNARCRSS